MKYYNLPDELLSAVRSLPHYQEYGFMLKQYGSIDSVKRFSKKWRLINEGKPQLFNILSIYSVVDFISACNCVHNAYMRTSRVRKRVERMVVSYPVCYFVTLTIEDEYIDESLDFWFNQVKKFCNAWSTEWIANEDYGEKKGRLHFHVVMPFDINNKLSIDDKLSLWVYGHTKCKRIRFDEMDIRRISRYCTKLARHATKDTAFRVLYSRKKKARD